MKTTLHAPKLIRPVSDRDHRWGPVDAPVTILEYGDYECPHCAAAHEVISAIEADIGERFCYVFRNFPLATKHPHAVRAAEAAEAAGVQGKFWEMHNLLFENQDHLESYDIYSYSQVIELDLKKFQYDLLNHVYLRRIDEDLSSAIRSGVSSTPSFFINGMRHNGGYDQESLLQAILAES
jgi:protein-disulfide isomerase